MTESELRQTFCRLFSQYLGCQTGDQRELFLVNVYNLQQPPLPRGLKMQPSYAWCAASVTAIATMLQLDDIFPCEMGCWEMMQLAKQMGIFRASPYTPQVGDIIFYDWANKKDGVPDHVGMVEVVADNYVTTIEGNANGGQCARRTIALSDPQILGFAAPNYASKTSDAPPTPEKPHQLVEGAEGYDQSYCGQYKVKTALYLRRGAGITNRVIATMPKNATVTCSGYYAHSLGSLWLYVAYGNSVGYCNAKYLSKL